MKPFTTHTGIAAPFLQTNINTDAIIPSREMKLVSKRGLSVGLFANWRYLSADSREPNTAFVLNQPQHQNTTILIAGENFGCGSSREHAVWALVEYGIRAILAPSFGAIFAKNCVNNGLLAGCVDAATIQLLADWVIENPTKHQLEINLETAEITGASKTFAFDIAPADRAKLLAGLDPIAYTLTKEAQIAEFEQQHFDKYPWAKL